MYGDVSLASWTNSYDTKYSVHFLPKIFTAPCTVFYFTRRLTIGFFNFPLAHFPNNKWIFYHAVTNFPNPDSKYPWNRTHSKLTTLKMTNVNSSSRKHIRRAYRVRFPTEPAVVTFFRGIGHFTIFKQHHFKSISKNVRPGALTTAQAHGCLGISIFF